MRPMSVGTAQQRMKSTKQMIKVAQKVFGNAKSGAKRVGSAIKKKLKK